MNGQAVAQTLAQLEIKAGARYWVAASGEFRAQLLAQLADANKGPHGWLAARDGMLVNLRVWENVLLPACYFGKAPCAVESERLGEWLQRLGVSQAELFCASRVDSLAPSMRCAVAALRTLLSHPALILGESEWFERVSRPHREVLTQLFQEVCPDAMWVVAGGAAPDEAWGMFQALGGGDDALA